MKDDNEILMCLKWTSALTFVQENQLRFCIFALHFGEKKE